MPQARSGSTRGPRGISLARSAHRGSWSLRSPATQKSSPGRQGKMNMRGWPMRRSMYVYRERVRCAAARRSERDTVTAAHHFGQKRSGIDGRKPTSLDLRIVREREQAQLYSRRDCSALVLWARHHIGHRRGERMAGLTVALFWKMS